MYFCLATSALDVTMRFPGQTFTEALNDPTSDEYIELRDEIKSVRESNSSNYFAMVLSKTR